MPVTTPDSIFYPDVSAPAAEITNLSTMAASIQVALALRSRFDYVWTNLAGRTAQTGMVDGSRGYQIDTGFDYKYNGTVWRNVTSGLVPIMPVSVSGTGVALGVGGQVNLTTVTSVQINGIFSAEFDNYRVDIDLPDSTASISSTMQLSVAGTPDTSASYDAIATQAVGTTAAASQAIATTTWGITPGAAGTNRSMDLSMEFKRPFLLKPTQCIATGGATSTAMTTSASIGQKLLTHRMSVSYDGLSIAFSAGTPTGVIHTYGWNNGAK